MDKPKFIAGPWRVGSNLNVYAGQTGSGFLIAEVLGHTHHGERQANAHLIATAPDLYAYIRSRALYGDEEALSLMLMAEGR